MSLRMIGLENGVAERGGLLTGDSKPTNHPDEQTHPIVNSAPRWRIPGNS
jgi:hypothetical protein